MTTSPTLRLEGAWEIARSGVDATVDGIGAWEAVQLPGQFLPGLTGPEHEKVEVIWARRRFELTAAQAASGVSLRWGGVRFGAKVWFNGVFVGEHEPIGPYGMLLPRESLRAGTNELVLRVPGWAGVRRSASGFTLAPSGSAKEFWGAKAIGIFEGIWLEFFHAVHLRGVLPLPDVDKRSVTLRLWLEGELPTDVKATVQVRLKGQSAIAGEGSADVHGVDGVTSVTVSLPGAKLWSLEDRVLYEALVQVHAGGELCDQKRVPFGMRDIRVRDGRFELNGRHLWLRGSNLVYEWLWGDRFRGHAKEYLVDEGRRMNLMCFRTHTLPPPHAWLDVCDEHGVLILAELPVLYNHADFKFTPQEQEHFNAQALLDAKNWVWELGHHPSIVLWVLTNEAPLVGEAWEKGPYWRFVKDVDPSRPAMRAGPLSNDGTPEVVDVHTCVNFNAGSEGGPLRQFHKLAVNRDPARTLGNSEFMNILSPYDSIARRWLGDKDHPERDLIMAEFAGEHTESLRRERYDLILPYMFAGWTGMRKDAWWRAEFPTPMAAALHSAMSPVLASLELFDRNFEAGAQPGAMLWLINELDQAVNARVELLLTSRNPEHVPLPAALREAIWREEWSIVLGEQSIQKKTVQWPMPAQPGVYYLVAVLRREGCKPVASQRIIRSIAPPRVSGAILEHGVVLLGADDRAKGCLSRMEIPFREHWDNTTGPPAAVVVWDLDCISEQDRQAAPAILEYVQQGGRIVVLDQATWTWPELIDFTPSDRGNFQKGISSRAFPHPGHRARTILAGLDPEIFKRWNGPPGTIADRSIQGAALAEGSPLLWIEKPEQVVLLSVAKGKGEIILSQLMLKDRLSPGAEDAWMPQKADCKYDPAAASVFLSMIGALSR
ncbi:MAG: hypothetical protein IT442_11400 [Phycisphaeraceae bacterium]|nr:hypothetical protein [Phycisphaeraceae bacterium]